MKKAVILSFFFVPFWFVSAQTDTAINQGYQLNPVYDIKTTAVDDQQRAGTCWSYSVIGFVEAEMLRLGKDSIDLSELFVVRMVYSDKAERYVRMHGKFNFGGGGAVNDVIDVIKKYGIVPEETYTGLNYGTDVHTHGEVNEVLTAYLDAVIKNENRKLTTAWKRGFDAILDEYFGKIPEKFSYKNKEYTPQTFAKEIVGINPDEYVYLTSFSHHPFYQPFIVEVEDNWSWQSYYNLPVEELIQSFDYAMQNGYSIGWAADVSEKGFSHKNGVAIVPEDEIKEMAGSERQKWEKLTKDEKANLLYAFDKPIQEKNITQQMRQEAFDVYQTTDDHGMLMCGLYKDQTGKKFYKIKNSWGTDNSKYNGFFYASEPYVKYKTMSVVVNKNSLPKEILKKLGIK